MSEITETPPLAKTETEGSPEHLEHIEHIEQNGTAASPSPANGDGKKGTKKTTSKKAGTDEGESGAEEDGALSPGVYGPLRKGYKLPWELEEWLIKITQAFGEATWNDGNAVGTTREIALVKILTFVRNLDRNGTLMLPVTREGERIETRLWNLIGDFEPVLTDLRSAIEILGSSLTSLDRKKEASRLLLAQIQSTSIVIEGRVVRAIPMAGPDGKITAEGMHMLEADMGDIPGSLKVREEYFLKWRTGVDAYRARLGVTGAELAIPRGEWLDKRAHTLTVEEKNNEPELMTLWTGIELRLRTWLADQE